MSSVAPPGTGKLMTEHLAPEFGSDDRFPESDARSYDVLRDLFLGAEEPAAANIPPSPPAAQPPVPIVASQTAEVAARTPLIDGLILGHLPVLQSAWVMQYARDTASQRGGPIALLRVRADETTLDLVGPAHSLPQNSSFDDALSAAVVVAKGFIIRVDATNEPALAGLDQLDAITLLTGADEVAILASYQTIKKLFPASDESGPEARLAIMGASPEKALEAASKLERTAAAFLDRPVTISACVTRIGPGKTSLLFRGKVDGGVGELVGRIRQAMLPKPAPTPILPPLQPLPTLQPKAFDEDPSPLPVDAPAPSAASVVSRLGHIQTETPATPPVTIAPDHPADARPLSAHLKGLTHTSIVCPYNAKVEFALDVSGGLHLLAYVDSGGSIDGAVASLAGAGGWTKSHLPLISLAMKAQGLRVDERAPPMMHLLAPTFKAGRGLSDAGIHLHVLARVEIEGRKGWFCTEIG